MMSLTSRGSCTLLLASRPLAAACRRAPDLPLPSQAPRPSVGAAAALRRSGAPVRSLRCPRMPAAAAANFSTNYSTTSPQAGMVSVTFQLPYKTDIGESFSIVGNLPELGEWSTEGALPLEWAEGHVWCGTLSLPVGTVAEFKCVLHGADGAETWQLGDNRLLEVPNTHAAVEVGCSWDIEAVSVQPVEGGAPPAGASLGSGSYSEEALPPSQDDYELQQARQTLQQSADKIDSLQRMVDDLRQNHAALQEEWEASGGQLTSDLYQQLIAAEQGLMDEARQLNGYAQPEAAADSPQMVALTQELARVKSEFSEAKGALADAHSQMAALSNELNSVASSYQEHLSHAEAEMASRMAQFRTERDAEIQELQRALAESQAAAQQGGSAGSQDAELEELRQELAATKAQLAQASQVQQSAAQEAQATGHEAGELKQRLQAAEAEIGSLRAWIDQAIEAQAGAPQQAPSGEQLPVAAGNEAEVEELRQQVAHAQYYMQQAVEGHQAAAHAAEEATRREYALYEQLQAAQAEIAGLRAWIDQAMSGQGRQQ
mmetsp:Transcript_18860/g.48418  ORF Transcript_18860/g.48418 Transcript_18860/m.48418 type:complete len:545 (-) Transcript_18860:94-1728(-)